MYYPLMFHPVYKEMIWGGSRLRDDFGRDTPYERTGESWDIACRKEEMVIVKNGLHKGMAFRTLIKKDTRGVLGNKYYNFPRFPLLIKLIDTADDVSVQVHPNDVYAKTIENYPQGKNEMWYILSAHPDSYVVLGLKNGVTKHSFKRAIADDNILNCLNRVPVKTGDIIDIPAGLLHAIGKDIILVEIQQNSDITYRVFDYDRVDKNGKKRDLHTRNALDCIDFTHILPREPITPRLIAKHDGASIYNCVCNRHFTTKLLDIRSSLYLCSNPETFHVLTIVSGDMYVEHTGGSQNAGIGESVLIPAALGDYTIYGQCKVILSYT